MAGPNAGGIGEVQSRMMEIQSRFDPAFAAAKVKSASKLNANTSFEQALAMAQDQMDPYSGSPGAFGGSSALAGLNFGGMTQNASGEQVIQDAKKYLGVPYVWGGTDPNKGLDCSGLVQRVYQDMGVTLPRVASDQAKVGRPIASLADAKPGDLVAFDRAGDGIDHIGIYAGNGMMIVAPKTGDVVKLERVYTSPAAIRRILPDNMSLGSASQISSSFQTQNTAPSALNAMFEAAGARNGVPPELLKAVAKTESNFNPSAVSSAGALGLMQIMPATAKGMGIDPMDPQQAIEGAARLLASHLKRFGSTELAVAAYNAGPNAVAHYGGIPPFSETQNYVRKVLALAEGPSN